MSYPSSGSQPGSAPALDPNLKCNGCGVQCCKGEIQEFKQHSSEVKSQCLQHALVGYREDFRTAEQKYDPNLTLIGCNKTHKFRCFASTAGHVNCSQNVSELNQKVVHTEKLSLQMMGMIRIHDLRAILEAHPNLLRLHNHDCVISF